MRTWSRSKSLRAHRQYKASTPEEAVSHHALEIESRDYLRNAIAIVIFDARLLHESVGDQKGAISHDTRIGGHFREHRAHSGAGKLARHMEKDSLSDAGAARSWRNDDPVHDSRRKRSRHYAERSEADELAVANRDTRAILSLRLRHCFPQQLRKSFQPGVLLLLECHQRKRGGEILLARRVHIESLQGWGKHGSLRHYLYMERTAEHAECGLLHRLGKRRVRMHGNADVL